MASFVKFLLFRALWVIFSFIFIYFFSQPLRFASHLTIGAKPKRRVSYLYPVGNKFFTMWLTQFYTKKAFRECPKKYLKLFITCKESTFPAGSFFSLSFIYFAFILHLLYIIIVIIIINFIFMSLYVVIHYVTCSWWI